MLKMGFDAAKNVSNGAANDIQLGGVTYGAVVALRICRYIIHTHSTAAYVHTMNFLH